MASDLSLPITVATDLDTTEQRVRECLSAEGFGVLTEIDVQATLRAKLDIAVDGYRILGACSPPLAHRAITADPLVGLLLPSNIVLRELKDSTRVEIANPLAMLALIDNDELRVVAGAAHERLQRVAAALSNQAIHTVACTLTAWTHP